MKRLISVLLAVLMVLPILASCEDVTLSIDANLNTNNQVETTLKSTDSGSVESDSSDVSVGTSDWSSIETQTVGTESDTDTCTSEPDSDTADIGTTDTDTDSNESEGNEPEGDGFQSVSFFLAYTYISTNIYQFADIEAESLQTLEASTQLIVLGKNDKWYKVKYGSVMGYIPQDFVSKNKSDTLFTDVNEYDQKTITVKESYTVNVREYPVISDFIAQKTVSLDYSRTSNGELIKIGENKSGTWYKVSYDDSVYYLKASSQVLSGLLIKEIPTPTPDIPTPDNPIPDDSDTDIDSSIYDYMSIDELLNPGNFVGADIPNAVDYGGYDFNMLVDATNFNKEFVAESDGELVKDALVNRQEYIEEYLGINFVFSEISGGYGNMEGYAAEIEIAFSSGKPYDLALAYNLIPSVVAVKGLSANIAESRIINPLNTNKEYWSKSFVDAVNINGKVFWMVDNASWNNIRNMLCIFVNTEMFETHNTGKTIDYLYDMVDNKQWTMENMLTLIENTWVDDGNDAVDDNDTFGLQAAESNAWLDNWFYAAGLKYTKFNNNQYEWTLGDSNTITFVNWWKNILNDNINIDKYDGTQYKMFFEERAMFSLSSVGMNEQNINFNYTVLPLPFFHKNIKNGYSTPLSNAYSAYIIPVQSKQDNFERSATVLELLTAEANRRVAPMYFEIFLKRQIASDDTDMRRMFNIIRNSVVFDFGHLYSSVLRVDPEGKGYFSEMQVIVRRVWSSDGLQSPYSSIEDAWNAVSNTATAKLSDLMTKFK